MKNTTTPADPLATIRALARQASPATVLLNLGRRFPELRGAPCSDPSRLDRWAFARYEEGDSSARAAARFLLSLWTGGGDAPWDIGPFDISDVRDLSDDSRAVIAAWIARPFWL